MAAFVVSFLLLLAMAAHSDASYCVCNSGLSDSVLQKNIDYACGNGADCSSILQNGPCYNPNTMRDHCNYAVNSYYQRKGQIPGSCDFQGTATVSPTAPSAGSGCVYQSSPSNGGSTTPTTGTPPNAGGTGTPPNAGGTGTPNAGGTGTPPNAGGTGTPPNAGGTGTPPNAGGTGTPPNAGGTTVGGAPNTGGTTIGGTPNTGSTTPGTLPGSVSPTIGLGPSGSGFSNTDGNGSVKLSSQSSTIFMLVSFSLSVLVYGLVL